MDPLSITASGIAIGGLGTGIVKGFRQYKRLHDAPIEVRALVDELTDAHSVVQQAESIALERLGRNIPLDCFTARLLGLVETSKKTILEIERIVYLKLIKDEDTVEKLKMARLAWLGERSRIAGLREGLRDKKMNLLIAIGSATL